MYILYVQLMTIDITRFCLWKFCLFAAVFWLCIVYRIKLLYVLSLKPSLYNCWWYFWISSYQNCFSLFIDFSFSFSFANLIYYKYLEIHVDSLLIWWQLLTFCNTFWQFMLDVISLDHVVYIFKVILWCVFLQYILQGCNARH